MKRRKTNVRQAIAAIRRDLIERFDIEVPTEEIDIVWRGGEREIWVSATTRQVWGSIEGRVYGVGEI